MKASFGMLDGKNGSLSAKCLQTLRFLNSEIFVRSVFFGSPSIPNQCKWPHRTLKWYGDICYQATFVIKRHLLSFWKKRHLLSNSKSDICYQIQKATFVIKSKKATLVIKICIVIYDERFSFLDLITNVTFQQIITNIA